ncbi:hypothetical protein Hanom_Chr03g00187201 [Helianthus anomalus]
MLIVQGIIKRKRIQDTIVLIVQTSVGTPKVTKDVIPTLAQFQKYPKGVLVTIHKTPLPPTKTPTSQTRSRGAKFIIQDDDEETPNSSPIKTTTTITPFTPIISLPLSLPSTTTTITIKSHPLEFKTISIEIQSFYSSFDPSQLSFPSLHDLPKPSNVKEYLELKLKHAEMIASERSKEKEDKEGQQILSKEFTKVNRIEYYAKDVSKKASQGPVSDPNLKRALRENDIEYIMKNNPYKATRAQFSGWSTQGLLEEIIRIEKLKLNLDIKPTPPNWRAGKRPNGKKAPQLKRIKEKMLEKKFGLMQ